MTSVADYNNNPGNLKPKGFTYKGQIGLDDRGFAIFESKDAGRSALIQDIRAKQSQGLNNPNAFIDKYTPAMKENPEEGRDNYKIFLAQNLGLKNTTDPFPKGSEEKIADLIAQFEGASSPAPTGKEESGAKKPFEDYKPRVITQDDSPPPPLEKNRTEKAIDYATDVGGAVVDKVVENPELPAAAGLGLIKGTLEKVLQNPEKHLVDIEKGETTPEEVKAAKTRAKDAQTRIGEIKQMASERVPIDVDTLQSEFDARKATSQFWDEELRTRQKDLKSLPKTSVPPVEPPAPSSPFPQVTREGRASGPKVEGDSGTRNWMIQEAGQQHQLPEVILDTATGKSKDSPTGGKALIDQDLRNLEKIKDLGMGDSKLTTTAGGAQLQLPSAENARLEQELAEKQAQEATEQAARAQATEAKRLAAEADLVRRRQEAEALVDTTRRAKIRYGESAADARKAANTARQQVAAQAKSDAGKIETATINARTAQQAAKEAAEAQPGALTVAAREAGRRFSEKLPIIGNVMGAAGATLSIDEAVKRANEGDTSGAVLGTIEAALNAASIAPPTSPLGLAVKGVGTVGSLGMIPVWLLHDYIGKKGVFAPKKEPQKARGGLTLMR
jgi:hypothetical protein